MKLCSKCGFANDDDAKECKNCYHKFELYNKKKKRRFHKQKTANKELVKQNPIKEKVTNPNNQNEKSKKTEYIKVNQPMQYRTSLNEKPSVLFDPSHKVWPNILLFITIFIEFIGLIYGIRMAIVEESWLLLGITLGTVIITHIIAMVSLNTLFNIQKIQENTTKIIELLSKNKND